MDGLPWPAITAASGGWLLTAAFVYAVLRGTLVPGRHLDDAHHEATEWRAEGRIKDQQLAEQATQLRHMGEVGHTVDAIMRSIQRGANREGQS